MPKLRYLGVNGSENEMKSLEKQLPEMAINKDIYRIARFGDIWTLSIDDFLCAVQ